MIFHMIFRDSLKLIKYIAAPKTHAHTPPPSPDPFLLLSPTFVGVEAGHFRGEDSLGPTG